MQAKKITTRVEDINCSETFTNRAGGPGRQNAAMDVVRLGETRGGCVEMGKLHMCGLCLCVFGLPYE